MARRGAGGITEGKDSKMGGIIVGKVSRLTRILKQFQGTNQEGHRIPMRRAIRAGPNKISGRASPAWLSYRIGRGSIRRKMLCGSCEEVDGSAVRGRGSAIQRGGKRDSGPLG